MITVEVPIDGEMELGEAKSLAAARAAEHVADPMVLAWHDRVTGRYSPAVECSCDDDRPPWQVYAESRGAAVRVEVGDLFTFLIAEGIAD